jgi:hypothetical protein
MRGEPGNGELREVNRQGDTSTRMGADEDHCGLTLDKTPKLLEYIESKHLTPSPGSGYNYSAAEK